MLKKSIVVAAAVATLASVSIGGKADAFNITPDSNGPTFVLNSDEGDVTRYAVKSIQGLNIFNEKYDVSFITGTFDPLYYSDNPLERGIATFYSRGFSNKTVQETVVSALSRLYQVQPFQRVEDINGNLWTEWNVPTVGGGVVGWFRATWNDSGYQNLTYEGNFGSGTLYYTTTTYATFVKSTAVPEPLTILGSLTAVGFGVALKRKFASVQKD